MNPSEICVHVDIHKKTKRRNLEIGRMWASCFPSNSNMTCRTDKTDATVYGPLRPAQKSKVKAER